MISSSPNFDGLRYNKYLKLGYYVFDVKSFYPHINELKEGIFRIKAKYIEMAKNRFDSLGIKGSHTKVSIHIRLTDYKWQLKVLYNMTHQYFFGGGYIEKAIVYFAQKYDVSIA